jgi:hypothetical protein
MAVVVVMLPASSLEQESQQTAQSLALRVAPLNERGPQKILRASQKDCRLNWLPQYIN